MKLFHERHLPVSTGFFICIDKGTLMKVLCPNCGGDGKETCHNPDHGFLSAMSFTDLGRIGCPVCGHDPLGKVLGGGCCETCNGEREVEEIEAREFCDDMGYDYKLIYE